ncbi:MAG TPA: HlyC/CorC family transporter [Desulfobacteraceae bacterium]|nr:HlyC/CorC family transporter [Desulfobacteraceae bacterium]
MDIFIPVIIIIFFFLLEGFFSGSEIGIVSADKIKLHHKAALGSKGAKLTLKMLEKPDWILSTTMLGTNLIVVSNTTFITALIINLFGESNAWLAVLLIAPVAWIFGEIIPKSIFQQNANEIVPRIIFILYAASFIFSPVLIIFTTISRIFALITGIEGASSFTHREEISSILELHEEEIEMVASEKIMIMRVFNFSKTRAYEIMVPLIDVAAIEIDSTCRKALEIAAENSHSKLPVYEKRIDKIIGVLNTLELFVADPEKSIKEYVRKTSYVPGSKSIKNLLMELRKDGDSVAIVVDEFGGAEGLITMEDIMEEVVEDMEDEYDAREPSQQWLRKIGDKNYIASARIEIDTLKEKLKIEMPESKCATLAGFLLEKAHDIPPAGSIIESCGVTYTILQATPQAIKEVRIRW